MIYHLYYLIYEIRLLLEEERRSNEMNIKKEAETQGRGRGRGDCHHDHDDEQPPWSDLLSDIVLLIVKKISFLDRRNAKFAFSEWGPTINSAPNAPFLLSYARLTPKMKILDPIDKIRYVLMLDEFPYNLIICSIKHGWLLLCDMIWKSIFFYNPFSQALIELPSNEQCLLGRDVLSNKYCLLGSYCFSTLPTSSRCIVLVEEFHKYYIRFIFCSRGDSKWKELYFPIKDYIFSHEDGNAVFYQGKAYRMASDGKLGVFDPITESWFVHDNPNAGVSEPLDGINYLVESNNDLFRIWTEQHPLIPVIVVSVRVYKLDQSGHMWKETKSLGGRCFFVSFLPRSVEIAEEFRGEQDMIYFVGETTEVGSFFGYDVRNACMNFPEGGPIQCTFYNNSCWIVPKWDCSSSEEEH